MGSTLDRWFGAVTFAEAGELETARQILTPQRNILLALKDDQPEAKVLACAANLCKRVNAQLDVLVVPPGRERNSGLGKFLGELSASGIASQLTQRDGTLGNEILRYVRERRQVLFVVIDSLASWGGKGTRPWEKLECPLVVALEDCGKV